MRALLPHGFLAFVLLWAGLALAQEREATDGPDDRSRIVLPEGWKKKASPSDTTAVYGSEFNNAWIMISSPDKQPGITLDEYARLAEEKLRERIENVQDEKRSELEQNGMKGQGLALMGFVKGQPVAYVNFAFEGPKYFHQLMGWTPVELWPKYQQDVLASFQTFEEQ